MFVSWSRGDKEVNTYTDKHGKSSFQCNELSRTTSWRACILSSIGVLGSKRWPNHKDVIPLYTLRMWKIRRTLENIDIDKLETLQSYLDESQCLGYPIIVELPEGIICSVMGLSNEQSEPLLHHFPLWQVQGRIKKVATGTCVTGSYYLLSRKTIRLHVSHLLDLCVSSLKCSKVREQTCRWDRAQKSK